MRYRFRFVRGQNGELGQLPFPMHLPELENGGYTPGTQPVPGDDVFGSGGTPITPTVTPAVIPSPTGATTAQPTAPTTTQPATTTTTQPAPVTAAETSWTENAVSWAKENPVLVIAGVGFIAWFFKK